MARYNKFGKKSYKSGKRKYNSYKGGKKPRHGTKTVVTKYRW